MHYGRTAITKKNYQMKATTTSTESHSYILGFRKYYTITPRLLLERL